MIDHAASPVAKTWLNALRLLSAEDDATRH